MNRLLDPARKVREATRAAQLDVNPSVEHRTDEGSLAAFIHTTTSPLELWARYYRVLPYFVSSANSNLSALLLWLIVRPVFALLLIGLVVLLSHDANSKDFAALCAVVGRVGVYHQTYDNIIPFPLL